jgi:prepilin-type N-terminal cleavage/methylation domain-containing protein
VKDELALISQRPYSDTWKRGFTLLEILMALAVVGLLSSAIIGFSTHLLAGKPSTPDDVFWQATQAARKAALEFGKDERLSFDPKTKTFSIADGINTKTLQVKSGADDLQVNFLSTQSASSSMLIAGTVIQTGGMLYVTFYSDGTCIPFQAQIRTRGGAHVLAIDPWTCARVLNPPPNSGF